MEIKRVALVIADISGYTQFTKMFSVSLLHAEQIITDLLDAVIDKAEYPLTLNKLEGDAVLLYATGDNDAAVARDVAKQVLGFFEAFQTKSDQMIKSTSECPCEACRHVASLKLKTILHFGEVALKRVRKFEELGGESVILAHRLLKNSVPANEYVLMTEIFHQLAGDLPNLVGEPRIESYADVGQIPVRVFYPSVPMPDRPLSAIQYTKIKSNWTRRILARGLGLNRPVFTHLPNDKIPLNVIMQDLGTRFKTKR